MIKALVTGGAGFIGSHLVERLLEDGHEVIVLDNLATGRESNLATAHTNPKFSFHQTDITDLSHIQPMFSRVDWVFHMAALADIVPSIQQPLAYHAANVDGTATVLEAARLSGVGRFIYAASSSCYGLPDEYPTPVTAPAQPMYPYALTKYVGEQYVLHWCQIYKLPSVSMRFFNVYGPRSRTAGAYGAVFGTFLAQKLAGRPFTVVGDGSQTRDFVFVTDVVDALVKAAESDISGEVFNVGSGGTYSINHLVGLLGGDVVYIPKRPGEPESTFADIQKTIDRLSWKPVVTFEAGVEMMIQGIDNWRDAPIWDQDTIAKATEDWFIYLGQGVN
jgi:UDP-glucose 4-epimerase